MPFLDNEEQCLGIAIEEDDDSDESGLFANSDAPKKHPEDPSVPQKRSMRRAINDYCKECTYDDCAPGNWRQQVTGCTVTTCPLYEFRPASKPRTKALGDSSG